MPATCKVFLVLEELATDVNMDSVVLDAEDLWDDLEATNLHDVSLTFQSILLVYTGSLRIWKT